MRPFCIFFFFVFSVTAQAQPTVAGRVFDNSKINYVENARVVSSSGKIAYTDSLGDYRIAVQPGDSLFFIYNNKPTQMFAVSGIKDPEHFDVSLHIPVRSKYNSLQEVVVYSKSYRQDSLENRQEYAKIFDYQKPGLSSSISPTGGVGLDLGELINVFRFRRNRSMRAFQLRLEEQEKDKYIDYRFSKLYIKRVTGLTGAELDSFAVWYRPTYEFTSTASLVDFNQYILDSFYNFKRVNKGEMRKEF